MIIILNFFLFFFLGCWCIELPTMSQIRFVFFKFTDITPLVLQESSEQLAMGEAFGIKAPEKKVVYLEIISAQQNSLSYNLLLLVHQFFYVIEVVFMQCIIEGLFFFFVKSKRFMILRLKHDTSALGMLWYKMKGKKINSDMGKCRCPADFSVSPQIY